MHHPGQRSDESTRRPSLGRLISQSTALLMVCVGTLILALALLILFHENATATKGYQLRSLQRERIMLLLEQEVFNMQIAESQSLNRLQEDGQVQGMLPATKPSYANAAPATVQSSQSSSSLSPVSSSQSSSLSTPSASSRSSSSGDAP